jgi:hypothetical protein
LDERVCHEQQLTAQLEEERAQATRSASEHTETEVALAQVHAGKVQQLESIIQQLEQHLAEAKANLQRERDEHAVAAQGHAALQSTVGALEARVEELQQRSDLAEEALAREEAKAAEVGKELEALKDAKHSVPPCDALVEEEQKQKVAELEEKLRDAEQRNDELDEELYDRETFVNLKIENHRERLRSMAARLQEVHKECEAGKANGAEDLCHVSSASSTAGSTGSDEASNALDDVIAPGGALPAELLGAVGVGGEKATGTGEEAGAGAGAGAEADGEDAPVPKDPLEEEFLSVESWLSRLAAAVDELGSRRSHVGRGGQKGGKRHVDAGGRGRGEGEEGQAIEEAVRLLQMEVSDKDLMLEKVLCVCVLLGCVWACV